jgi:hypothetical protein
MERVSSPVPVHSLGLVEKPARLEATDSSGNLNSGEFSDINKGIA